MRIESNTVSAKNKAGGKNEIFITHLLTPAEMVGQCEMFASVVIPPGASIGEHYHYGNTETYHILSGVGTYSDDGDIYEVFPGDTVFCPDGSAHSIENKGNEDLKFIALIIKSPKAE